MYVADFLELLDDGRSSAFSVENTYIGENKSAVFLSSWEYGFALSRD